MDNSKKNIKRIIVILCIVLIIMLIAMYAITNKKIRAATEEYIEEEAPEGDLILEENGTNITNFQEYSTVKDCLNILLSYQNAQNEEAINDINGEDNIFESQDLVKDDILLKPIHMVDNNMTSANFVSFKICNQETQYYGIVLLDYSNKTFKIIKSTEDEYNNAMNNIVDDKYKEPILIEAKKYNKFKYLLKADQDVVKEYVRDYVKKALYHPQEAYNSLSEKCRSEKFQSFEEYQQYISKNRQKLKMIELYSACTMKNLITMQEYDTYYERFNFKESPKYKMIDANDDIIYICVDEYENYYIFKASEVMEYSVLYVGNYTDNINDYVQGYDILEEQGYKAFNIIEN